MKFKWIKEGLVIKPGRLWWARTHAQNPSTEKVGKDLYRIHFAGRDKNGYARGGYAVMNMKNPTEILKINPKPTLDIGELGCFDDCGAMPSCIVSHGNKKYMYYTGWTQKVATPFAFFIGLAISNDGGVSYRRHSKSPILGFSQVDPYMTASPFVLRENNVWKMWYVSCTGWVNQRNNSKAKHFYHIKYAESKDGINWVPTGIVCIDYKNKEYAIARPAVYKENGIYKMWYCYRGGKNSYRAGYAESKNGKKWTRKDKNAGIDVSKSGWDSEMICYPFVFAHAGKKYMLYNGNGFGKTGCGLAASK